MAVRRICESIVRDEHSILPISSLTHGEYGIDDICLSLPAIVSANGVEKIVPISLNEEEMQKLKESAEALHKVVEDVL